MTLYHYCSNEALVKIVNNRTLRLNHLSHSNDFLEGRWISIALKKICEKNKSTPQALRTLEFLLNKFQQNLGALGLCLSEEGDILSQWRGYANNGTGVSVGFNEEFLNELLDKLKPTSLPVNLKKVS